MIELGANRYGKAAIRLVRVVRGDLTSEVGVAVTRSQLPETHHEAFKRGAAGERTPVRSRSAVGVWLLGSLGR